MGEPKHQHFIPKSFLKQFAQKVADNRYLVDTIMKGKEEIKTLPTTQVCVQKNIYTFPVDIEGDRFKIEKRYAVEVDGVYPSAYALLSDSSLNVLNPDQKRSILNTILSLYFRTPFFLNRENEKLDHDFNELATRVSDLEEVFEYTDSEGRALSFRAVQLENVRSDLKAQNKTRFLENHLEEWQKFVDFKMTCGMEVISVPNEVPLISSDNPVLILGPDSKPNPDNIFDPNNIIEIALDRTRYLVIYPNVVSNEERMYIRRGERDKYFAAGVNLRTAQTSDGRILGYPGDIVTHQKSQQELGEFTPENIEYFENFRDQALALNEIFQTGLKSGSIFSKEAIEKMKEINMNGRMSGNREFEKIKSVFEALGIDLG